MRHIREKKRSEEAERRGEMYAEKNGKVEREGKSRDKVNESHEESGLLIKTYGDGQEAGERSIYPSEKAPPTCHRAISVAWRGR